MLFDEKEQFIKVCGPSGKIVRDLSVLWNLLSKNPIPDIPASHYAPELVNLFDAVKNPKSTYKKIANLPIYPGQKVLIGFSGGKDSLASALQVQAQGGHPVLFYVKGINKSYPDEQKSAVALSARLQLQLIQKEVSISGSSDYIENPIKNQFILGMMVEHGLAYDISTYCQGNLLCDTIKDQSIATGYSDSIEMYQLIEEYFIKRQSAYTFVTLLENDTDSLETIARLDYDLLKDVRSCMSPLRYREGYRKHNIKKFGLRDTLPNRCYSCYKCALEWLHLYAFGAVESEGHAFIAHCTDMLVRGLSRSFGRIVTREEACDNFLNRYSEDIKRALC